MHARVGLKRACVSLVAGVGLLPHTARCSTHASLGSLVDLARYPIHAPESPEYAECVAIARAALRTTGCASFPGFLTAAALRTAAGQAAAVAPAAFETDDVHNAYQLATEPALSENHVRNMKMRTMVASIAFDELDPAGPLKQLYSCEDVVTFLSDVVERPLHRLADPLGACTVNIFRPGWSHAWHFDEAEVLYTCLRCLSLAQLGPVRSSKPPSPDSLHSSPQHWRCSILRRAESLTLVRGSAPTNVSFV